MLEFAPRISQRLRREIERQAPRREPIAEINRRVGEAARQMRLPRPSYEQVRILVHDARLVRLPRRTVSVVAIRFGGRRRGVTFFAGKLTEHGPRRRDDRSPPGM